MAGRRAQIEALLESMMTLKHRAVFSKSCRLKGGPRITPAQWGVVLFVSAHKGCTIKDLASAFSITSSAATQLVNGLVQSSYLMRKSDARDRRIVTLHLSKRTDTHVAQMKRCAVKHFLQMFEPLSDREFAQYCAINKKLARSATD